MQQTRPKLAPCHRQVSHLDHSGPIRFIPAPPQMCWAPRMQLRPDRAILRSMEATYRIISRADGTFAVERTEPGKAPVITGHFKTEDEARAHVANLKRRPTNTD
jgi:hypothetical protein